nr:MAG TPA: hypothetical protein [Bacteriophage sp.]
MELMPEWLLGHFFQKQILRQIYTLHYVAQNRYLMVIMLE